MQSYSEGDFFRFKEFKLANKYASFKINTDGVLLAAWSKAPDLNDTILDIGTGTGIIAVIKALQEPTSRIDAIDIDKQSCDEAVYNFEMNDLQNKITCYNYSLAEFRPKTTYNYIISNPPFYNTAQLPQNKRMALAKHNTELNIKQLWVDIARLAASHCMVALIYGANENQEHINHAKSFGFKQSRVCEVSGKIGGKVIRYMAEFSKLEMNIPKVGSSISIRAEDGVGFTKEYKEICSPYYLWGNNQM